MLHGQWKVLSRTCAASAAVVMAFCVPNVVALPAAVSEMTAGYELSLADVLNIQLKTGSFLELDMRHSPVTMTLITKDQLAISGAKNISEALEIYVPSFQYMINKWNGIIYGMQGVASDRNDKIIVMVNGRKVNFQSVHGFASDYSLNLLGSIERIEVLRGPAGLVYGSGAIAGVVNIVTLQAEAENKSYASVNFENSPNNGLGGVSVEGGLMANPKPDQKLSVNVGYRKSNGIGNNSGKVFGNYENNSGTGYNPAFDTPTGHYTGGSWGQTPGDWLASMDYSAGNFRGYFRATHEYISMAPFFLANPWANNPGGKFYGDTTKRIGSEVYNAFAAGTKNFQTDPYRNHVRENIQLNLEYSQPIGVDKFLFSAAATGTTNRWTLATVPGVNDARFVNLGERRYEFGAKYLLKRIENIQVAIGVEDGIYDLGNDLTGNNNHNWGDGPWYDPVTYNNFAAYGEGNYALSEKLGFEAGIRFDKHTRTKGVFSPKIALIATPTESNTIKFIIQSSSNNADMFTYELSHGNPSSKPWTYEKGAQVSRGALDSLSLIYGASAMDTMKAHLVGNLVGPASLAEMHNLKPEKSISFELASTNRITDSWEVGGSISYNMMRELFMWNSAFQKQVNLGKYDAVTGTIETGLDINKVKLGGNVTLQLPLNFSNAATAFERPLMSPVYDTIRKEWMPIDSGKGNETIYSDIVGYQLSKDGRYFNNLSTWTTKIFADYSPTTFVTFHADARIFWGLQGRDSVTQSYINQGISETAFLYADGIKDRDGKFHAPMTKLDASVLFHLPKDFDVGIYGYSLLGNADNLNAVRWQQMTAASQADYYTVDQRNYALKITKKF